MPVPCYVVGIAGNLKSLEYTITADEDHIVLRWGQKGENGEQCQAVSPSAFFSYLCRMNQAHD